MSSSSELLGIVVLARHGDREGFYQDPDTYTASQTSITPLGNSQEFQLGQLLRTIYLEDGSSSLIQGISTGLFNQLQVQVRADAGGERGVIFDSSISVVQGLWPPTTDYNTTLANGTTVVAPLSGYQYVPIESVEPDEDVSLEGWTSCNTFNNATSAFYKSDEFKKVASDNADFLASLPPYLDGRAATLENMWNIFDYMNVQSIHNSTFANNLPDNYLARVRALANYHEYGVFSSPQLDGIGNIAFRTMIPSVINSMDRIANTSDTLKLAYQAISYKPFLSLFNMTGVASTYPELAGVVEYAASTVFEIRSNPSSTSDPLVRLLFKNGSADSTFTTLNMFNLPTADVSLSVFKSNLQRAAINSTSDWCIVCANGADRGCGTCENPALASAAAATIAEENGSRNGSKLTLAEAGVIGAAVTAATFIALFGALVILGIISVGRKSTRGAGNKFETGSSTEKLDHESDHSGSRTGQ